MITVFSRSGTDDERALALRIAFRRVPRAGVQECVRRGRISFSPAVFLRLLRAARRTDTRSRRLVTTRAPC